MCFSLQRKQSTIDQLDKKNVKSDLPQRSQFARKKNRGFLNNICSSVCGSVSEICTEFTGTSHIYS